MSPKQTVNELPPYNLLQSYVRKWLEQKRWGSINNPYEGAVPRWREFLKPYYRLRFGNPEHAPSLKSLYAIFYGVRGMPEDLYGLMTDEMGFECPWWALVPADLDGNERKALKGQILPGVRQSYFQISKPRRELSR